MRSKALTVILAAALLVVTLLAVAPSATSPADAAVASTVPTSITTPTSFSRSATECISANPRPECADFERRSTSHLILFVLLTIALAGIGAVVVTAAVRANRSRRVAP